MAPAAARFELVGDHLSRGRQGVARYLQTLKRLSCRSQRSQGIGRWQQKLERLRINDCLLVGPVLLRN